MSQINNNFKLDNKRAKKRILLFNPVKKDNFIVSRIHMGLTLLGSILVEKGFEVKIIDYAFLKRIKHLIEVPEVEDSIHNFKPDVVGISVFTYLYDECNDLIDRISSCSDVPIILGGPHFTIFPQDFNQDKRISYIIRGEAENIIIDLVTMAKKQATPKIITAPLPLATDIPEINLDIVYGSQYLNHYQIQLSRGCPYSCTFCNIHILAGRRIRSRNLKICLEQITSIKKRYPNIRSIAITDDCPTFDKERFKNFLRYFKEAKLDCTIWVDNMRANLIDEEMIILYKAAGGANICLGVESGDPYIFNLVNKGETLDDIKNVAQLIKKYNLELGLCFVIGLPEDNLRAHRNSIKLAKLLRPNYVFWNMCIPWPVTEVYHWYCQNGTVLDMRNFSTLIDPRVNFKKPVAFSKCFSQRDRIKAWLMANLEIQDYFNNISDFFKIVSLIFKYNLYWSFGIYLFKKGKFFLQKIKRFLSLLKKIIISFLCLSYAFLKQLPGLRFDLYARGIAIKGILKGMPRSESVPLLLNPVSSVRYFEFDFVRRCLRGKNFKKVLDVSSPRILPLWMADNCNCNVTMINPDRKDLKTSKIISQYINNKAQLEFLDNVYATSIPYPDNSFDLITSISVLEHIADNGDKSSLEEFIRLVKPQGVIVLTIPVLNDYCEEYRDADIYNTQLKQNSHGKYFFQRFYDEKNIKTRLLYNPKIKVMLKEYFVETRIGAFKEYEKQWINKDLEFTIKDPWLMSNLFNGPSKQHPEDRMGICCLALEIVK